jgi:hypothetical protein
MKIKEVALSVVVLFLTYVVSAQAQFGIGDSKAIFGADNRRDVYQAPARFKKLAPALATWLAPLFVQGDQSLENGNQNTSGFINLDFPTMEDHYLLCSDEKFAKQPTTMISCTGFLIADDLLMTAGHCMVNVGQANNQVTPMCSDFNWLFDFQYNRKGQDILHDLPANTVSACSKVLFAKHLGSGDGRMDFALIRLARKYPNRAKLKISTETVRKGQPVHIMGYPSGLPLKYAGGAFVLNDKPGAQFFEANVDAVGGNSGSPVMNVKGEVVGILVRGNDDFVEDKQKSCDRWNRCHMSGRLCRNGEQEEDFNSGMHVQKFSPELITLLRKFVEL